MFEIICLLLSIIIYAVYVVYIRIKYKPDCISESYYLLKHGNIFSIWVIIIAFLIFPSWVEITSNYFQFLPFLSVIALIVVGLNPKYLGSDRVYHIAGATITSILSIIWNIVTETTVIPIILSILAILLSLIDSKNKLFWIECMAFANIYSSIIFELIQIY